MSLATLSGSKISVIEASSSTVITFPTLESALSALVKHNWKLVAALDQHTVLFQHPGEDTPLHHIEQLRMAARLTETMAHRRAVARLAVPAGQEKAYEKS